MKRKETIFYGDDSESIYTEKGKAKLWEEEKIIYNGGIFAFKIIELYERKIIEVWEEDDSTLYQTNKQFHIDWLLDLKNIIELTELKVKELK